MLVKQQKFLQYPEIWRKEEGKDNSTHIFRTFSRMYAFLASPKLAAGWENTERISRDKRARLTGPEADLAAGMDSLIPQNPTRDETGFSSSLPLPLRSGRRVWRRPMSPNELGCKDSPVPVTRSATGLMDPAPDPPSLDRTYSLGLWNFYFSNSAAPFLHMNRNLLPSSRNLAKEYIKIIV